MAGAGLIMNNQLENVIENCEGRLKFLLDWLEMDKWFPSQPGQYPTRVVKKWTPTEEDAEAYTVVKVVINPSINFENHWAPILEIDRETVYLSSNNEEGGPVLPHQWYNCPRLAKLAAFEFLWPTSMESNWEGFHEYYTDWSYEEYYEWAYGHPMPNE